MGPSLLSLMTVTGKREKPGKVRPLYVVRQSVATAVASKSSTTKLRLAAALTFPEWRVDGFARLFNTHFFLNMTCFTCAFQ